MDNFQMTSLKSVFNVSKIVTVHYFEYEKNYSYIGESHDFWEMVYADKGDFEIQAGNEVKILNRGFAVFHKPGEYHNLWANGIVAPNSVIITFVCNSPAMSFFEGKILPLSDLDKNLLAQIIRESIRAFSTPLEDTFSTGMVRREEQYFGCEQMIKLSAEQLLISLYRNFGGTKSNTTTLKRGLEHDILNKTLNFLETNICRQLTFSEICSAVGVSGTSLKNVFKERMGEGVMTHFAKMKTETAKSRIREGNYNITQIAAYLGFDSIHVFSRRFRQVTGMSPTEYGKSVKVEFE